MSFEFSMACTPSLEVPRVRCWRDLGPSDVTSAGCGEEEPFSVGHHAELW